VQDVLAAALRVPEDFLSLGFPGQIERTDGEGRVGAAVLQPAPAAGSLVSSAGNRMEAKDGNQRQSSHIHQQVRQRTATFIGEAGQRRMNLGRIRIG
jgi:hypothetical protein